jgi:uncharacterized membrane protein YccC
MLRRMPMGSIEPVYLRTAVLATLAVVVSYSIGNVSTWIAADIAAIWALVTVRAAFHVAVRETIVQISGSLVGGLIGFLAMEAYGFSLGLLALLVLFSFAAGMLLRLGLEGSVIMGFTIIAVMSNSFSLETTEARVAGVVVGTVVAALFSLLVSSGTPQTRVRKDLELLQTKKQELLSEVGEALAAGPLPADTLFSMKISSKIIVEDTEKLEDRAAELLAAAKWSPLTSEEEATILVDDVKRLKEDSNTLADMLDSLEALGASLPATVADYAKWSVARAAQSMDPEEETIASVEVPQYVTTDLTPTQVIYTSDFIAGAEKIRRRRHNKIVLAPTPKRQPLRSVASKLKSSTRGKK